MSETTQELNVLMARLASGERAAFNRVFELLWGPVLKFCEGVLKNHADAADAAQEAMYKIFERASDYDKTRPAMPWAMAIAGWECRTVMRKHVRRKENNDSAVEAIADDNPQEQLITRSLTEAATTALGTLSAIDQEVLLATFWDEGASVSGATLRKRRERAIDRLRGAFRRLYGLD